MYNICSDEVLSAVLDELFPEHRETISVTLMGDGDRVKLYKVITPGGDGKFVKIFKHESREPSLYNSLQSEEMYSNIVCKSGVNHNKQFLVLNDISAEYCDLRNWSVPVHSIRMEKVLSTVANFHSILNQKKDNLLKEIGIPWHLESKENYHKHLDFLERDYKKFLSDMPVEIDSRMQVYFAQSLEFLRENAGHLFDLRHRNRLSFIHGDLNAGNVYYPVNDGSEVLILDLEAVRLGMVTDDLVMLLVNDLYHGSDTLLSQVTSYYSQLHDSMKRTISESDTMNYLKYSIREGLFFPMKLYFHNQIVDNDLLMRIIDAYESLVL